MELQKLAETVLYQLECFRVLQELDEGWSAQDPAAVKFLTSLYATRSVQWRLLATSSG